MKTIIKKTIAISTVLLFATSPTFSQSESEQKIKSETIQSSEVDTIQVSGNCGMCKRKIEGALSGNPKIQSAVWNVESKILVVNHTPEISALDIMTLVAKAGYDTEKVKASNEAYAKLPGCCQYDR